MNNYILNFFAVGGHKYDVLSFRFRVKKLLDIMDVFAISKPNICGNCQVRRKY